eukprot:gene3168-6248_t
MAEMVSVFLKGVADEISLVDYKYLDIKIARRLFKEIITSLGPESELKSILKEKNDHFFDTFVKYLTSNRESICKTVGLGLLYQNQWLNNIVDTWGNLSKRNLLLILRHDMTMSLDGVASHLITNTSIKNDEQIDCDLSRLILTRLILNEAVDIKWSSLGCLWAFSAASMPSNHHVLLSQSWSILESNIEAVCYSIGFWVYWQFKLYPENTTPSNEMVTAVVTSLLERSLNSHRGRTSPDPMQLLCLLLAHTSLNSQSNKNYKSLANAICLYAESCCPNVWNQIRSLLPQEIEKTPTAISFQEVSKFIGHGDSSDILQITWDILYHSVDIIDESNSVIDENGDEEEAVDDNDNDNGDNNEAEQETGISNDDFYPSDDLGFVIDTKGAKSVLDAMTVTPEDGKGEGDVLEDLGLSSAISVALSNQGDPSNNDELELESVSASSKTRSRKRPETADEPNDSDSVVDSTPRKRRDVTPRVKSTRKPQTRDIHIKCFTLRIQTISNTDNTMNRFSSILMGIFMNRLQLDKFSALRAVLSCCFSYNSEIQFSYIIFIN